MRIHTYTQTHTYCYWSLLSIDVDDPQVCMLIFNVLAVTGHHFEVISERILESDKTITEYILHRTSSFSYDND